MDSGSALGSDILFGSYLSYYQVDYQGQTVLHFIHTSQW